MDAQSFAHATPPRSEFDAAGDDICVPTPTPSGARLEYNGRGAPGFGVFGRIEEYAVRDYIARQFQALIDEIERSGKASDQGHAKGAD